jgi:hypothetical protein
MPSTFARTVMLAAPSVAMAVVGLALFGPGAARSFQTARVSGGPTEGSSSLSFRVAVTRRYRGIDSIVAGKSIELRATSRGDAAAARCVTGADGICDVELPLKKRTRGPIDLFVGAAGGNEPALASGTVEGSLARWAERPPRGPEIVGTRGGDLEIRLFALRGVFAAPFPDELQLSVQGPGGDARARASVAMSLVGGDVIAGRGTPSSSTAGATTDEQGLARWTAIPRAHAVEVNVEAHWKGAYGTFFGTLPVVPGAIWLEPDTGSKGLRIVSPVPRARAYAMFATRTERVWGGTISLENDEHGFASAPVPWPDLRWPGAEPVWLVLSGDPESAGLGTVGWPILGDAGEPRSEQSFADALLLDGMPAAEHRENDRRRRAAWLVALALGATAGLEAALVLASARSQGKGGLGRVVAAVAAIVLAFAAIGIVAMWKAAG